MLWRKVDSLWVRTLCCGIHLYGALPGSGQSLRSLQWLAMRVFEHSSNWSLNFWTSEMTFYNSFIEIKSYKQFETMRHFRSFPNIVGPKLKANDDTYFLQDLNFSHFFPSALFQWKVRENSIWKSPIAKKFGKFKLSCFSIRGPVILWILPHFFSTFCPEKKAKN